MRKCEEPGTSVSVLVSDATRMACQLMSTALQRSRYRVAVVGCAVDSVEIQTELGKNQPDVAVISAHLRDGLVAGFNVTREVRISHPEMRVVMLLDSVERAMVIEAFRAGADGIISRDKSFEVLCKCIQAVHRGEVWASSEELRFVFSALPQIPLDGTIDRESTKRAVLLTKREEGLARLVAEGFTNRDISRHMNLSENTVRNYLFRIFNKLGTSNRLELALHVINQRERDRVA